MCLSGYVNTNYLFSMTEEDADEEQQKLYRLKYSIIHILNNSDFLTASNEIRLHGRPCWSANTDPVSISKL